ncbi:hypothetical protein ACFPES_32335 [Paenibacillus sp. GCM10023248]|uniref:hypothetical protein n=1 Tax=unclassified Paenibacillus TaxID=185978 RepID=UPI0023780A7D|nr:hypothetical protein [Paenibacillus sp. MAHUQ-63]MDD9271732.1 hypothetical protein [Paenibacillus sp. MAHUQ-63]
MTIKKKINRNATVKRKIKFSSKDARITQPIGNGFRRFVFTRVVIPPKGMAVLIMNAGAGRRVVSGGWSQRPIDPKTSEVFSTESYPITPSEWRITVWNNTTDFQAVIPYLIDKRR